MLDIPNSYALVCLATGTQVAEPEGNPMLLRNPASKQAGLLRATYQQHSFRPGDPALGIYRYSTWLPIRRMLPGSSAPATYRSSGLARALGLNRLYITFSGYWPERGTTMLSGTFKECEAYTVCARPPASWHNILVVASAGNTARAFIHVCLRNHIAAAVVVPEQNLSAIWSTLPLAAEAGVRLIAVGDDADYADTIEVANRIAQIEGFAPEGGAQNVARRDGMGTTVLSAVEKIGAIPHWYVQAIGSGTGAIAAWEANLRLLKDGQFKRRTMRMLLAQNSPFLPMYEAWKRRSPHIATMRRAEAKARIKAMYAPVLSNRIPPYGVKGGLYDALCATGGDIVAVENEAARAGGRLFQECEGIDISPAASVAVAALQAAVATGQIAADEIVMLNITGGGIERIHREQPIYRPQPDLVLGRRDRSRRRIRALIPELFK